LSAHKELRHCRYRLGLLLNPLAKSGTDFSNQALVLACQLRATGAYASLLSSIADGDAAAPRKHDALSRPSARPYAVSWATRRQVPLSFSEDNVLRYGSVVQLESAEVSEVSSSNVRDLSHRAQDGMSGDGQRWLATCGDTDSGGTVFPLFG